MTYTVINLAYFHEMNQFKLKFKSIFHALIKCYSGHLMKMCVFFHIVIYIAGLKKTQCQFFFQYRAALLLIFQQVLIPYSLLYLLYKELYIVCYLPHCIDIFVNSEEFYDWPLAVISIIKVLIHVKGSGFLFTHSQFC